MADGGADQLDEAAQGISWTPGREAVLRDMWMRGLTASAIASNLQGVSRNAVITMAHRLSLPSRRRPSLPNETDVTIFLTETRDPILDVYGCSVALQDLLEWRWDENTPYLDRDAARHLRLASRLASRTNEAGTALVTAGDIASAFRLRSDDGSKSSNSRLIRKYSHILEAMPGVTGPPQLNSPRDGSILRWDAALVIAAAASIRSRIRRSAGSIELPHLIAGMLSSPQGQSGVERAGLANAQLEPFRTFAAAVADDYATHLKGDDARQVAAMIAIEVRDAKRFRGPTLPRTRYASDRVADSEDAMGVVRDARALADLVLLEAASPPLAIGVFGAWGSGKSTLLALLRKEISEQVEQERISIVNREAVEDPALRRVAGVMQIEFNAWSFADSDNLWASLTSDIFDQIAAGGIDGTQRSIGVRMVAEVAERTSTEAGLLRAAHSSLQESEARIRSADAALASARLDERAGPMQAVFDVAIDLLGGEAKEKDGRHGKKASSTHSDRSEDVVAMSGAADQTSSAAQRTSDQGKEKTPFVEVFRRAVLINTDATSDELIRGYADAGSSVSRTLLMTSDFIRARPLRSALVGVAAIGAGLSCYFGAGYLVRALFPEVKALLATLMGVGAFLVTAFAYLLPALRVAGLLGAKIKERDHNAREKLAKAQTDWRAAETLFADADIARQRSRKFVEKYSDVREIGSSPGLMLDYLLEESSEISRLRGSLGTLGTARKAFEKLNAIVRENAADRSSPVQRIVIYIDDLDRCSERQVVQILEAIHLLMAFPCFVVVAAVDARWLDASLRTAHPHMELSTSGVGPAEYLEKIFQIPFWVRRLSTDSTAPDGGAYGRMIDELAGHREEVELDPGEEGDDAVDEVSDGPANRGFTRVAPAGPDLLTPPERQLQRLSAGEITLFHEFGGLAARSPRAVKRMINVYRLIRLVSTTAGDDTFIIGPELDRVPAALVQFAVACEVGLASPLMKALVRLVEDLTEDQWSGWLTTLGTGDLSMFASSLATCEMGPRTRTAVEDAFAKSLTACSAAVEPEDLRAAFRIASRYSFRAPPELD